MRGSSSLADVAYARLKELILSGELPPDAAIDEPGMAREFGISRTPVREALLRLKAEGLVEIARGRGIRVKALSAKEMRALYQAISGIETAAVFLAARRRPGAKDMAALEAALDDLESSAADGDDERWCRADERFHRELLKLSGNEFLAAAGLQLRDRVERAHLVAARMQPAAYKEHSTANHRRLVDLIRSGRAARSSRAHLRQRLRGEDALLSLIDRIGLRAL